MTQTTTMARQYEGVTVVRHEDSSSFADWAIDETVDAAATMERFEAALSERFETAFPGATVDVRWENGFSGWDVRGGDNYAIDGDVLQGEYDAWLSDGNPGPFIVLQNDYCIYCGSFLDAAGEPVPPRTDDEAWRMIAGDHASDCEWVRTRAHMLYPDEMEVI